LAFDPFNIDLPVKEIIPAVREQLSAKNALIVGAPPGAGKSTLLPLALLQEAWLAGKKIIMLEPRRLAAKTIALRMAQLLGEDVGQTIGYRIRFETRIGKNTRLEVVTEGILTRMLQSDNALEDAGLVIFDEFHERSLHADLALALCREAQQVLRPDLRILIMSATLNMPQLSTLLNAPVVESQGRQFPVEVIYNQDADPQFLPELAARQVAKAVSENDGDALVFLPGEAEIRKCETLLQSLSGDFSIHPLYGQLSPQEQFAAIMPNKLGRRKIVLATSIAETSLTIEGVRIVVDSGFGRTQKFDTRSGLSRLETIRISKDSADQRAGRAGRLSSGVCYRMWTTATHARLAEQRIPEILEADLTPLMLEMALWGISDVQSLTWLTPPPNAVIAQALDTLWQINALEGKKITAHGKQIHRLACHPRIAHMLLMAAEGHNVPLATDIAALLEERDPLSKEAGTDLNLRIEALRRARSNKGGGRFARIEKNAASYRALLKTEPDNSPVDPHETGLLLAFAYPERIASARPGNNAQFQLANGKYAQIGHADSLAHEPWLAVANMDLREGLGKIFLAAPLNPKDLLPLVKEKESVFWDTRKGGLVASRDLRIGSIVLQSKPLTNPNEQLVATAISEAIKTEGTTLLNFDTTMEQLQNRILSLKTWEPNGNWPDASTTELLRNNTSWLGPYLNNIKKPEDLKKINLAEALLHSLDWEQQQALNVLAPARLEVPSGSKINLQYFPNGATPVLAVRLQEVFGLADTPTVNNRKIKIVLHLLSPGYKPVQVTSDLKSFWNNLYFEVKNELRRRYPKHAWPDDPWTAPAVAKGRSHK
jgi:ATP-dependent helicase HrpB